MVKRKYKQSNRKDIGHAPRTEWDTDDEVELLAWLDCCLVRKTDFKASIIDRLMESRGKNYTFQQVDNKLRSIWNKFGSDESKSRKDLYREGTDCLSWLEGEDKEIISKATKSLLNQLPPEEISTIGKSSSESGPKSTSRTIGPESQRYPSQEYRAKATPQSSRLHRRKALTYKRQKASGGSGNEIGSLPVDKRMSQSTTRRMAQRSKPDQIKRSSKIQARDTTNSDSEDGTGFIGDDEDIINVSAHVPVDKDKIIVPIADSNRTHPQRQENGLTSSASQQFERSHEANHLPVENLNATLHRRMQRQDTRIASLFNKLKSLSESIQDHSACLASAMDQQKDVLAVYKKENEISELKQKWRASRIAGSFTTHSIKPFIGVTENEIKTRIGDMENEIDEIVHLNDDISPSLSVNIAEITEIRGMFHRSVGLDLQSTFSQLSLFEKFSRTSPESVLRALVAAALQEWVFESDFPNFDEDSSRVLAKYREHLALQDGPSVLRSLDTAAHYSLINDEHFQTRIIPEKAEELAIRLSQILTPFYPDVPLSPLPDGFQTWGQMEEEYQERRAKFISLFENALRLKADLILKLERYEMVTHLPGAVFDAVSMQVDKESDISVKPHLDGLSKIQLCLFPALYSYNDGSQLADGEEVSAMDEDLPHITVQYRNFTQRSDTERRRAKLVSKAVVILEEPEAGPD